MGFRAATMAAIATLGTTAAFGMGGAGVSRRTVRPAASSASRALSSAGGDGAAERAMILRRGSAASRASIASPGGKSGGRRGELTITAVTGPRETRIASILTTLPTRIELYFRVRRGRRTLWKAISAFAGFYTANVREMTFAV